MSGGGGSGGKGPSADDTSYKQPLKTIEEGYGTSTNDPINSPVTPIDTALPVNNVPTYSTADQFGASRTPTYNFLNVTGDAGANTTGTTGVGQPTERYSPFNTVADPTGGVPLGTTGVWDTGTTPFQTYGTTPTGAGDATSPTGAAPTGAAPTGGVNAPTPPTGVTPPTGADPTSPVYDPNDLLRQNQTGKTPTSPTGAPAPIPAKDGTGGFSLEKLFGGLTQSATNNPLGFLGAAGMAYNAYKTNQALKNIPPLGISTDALQKQAAQLNEQGQKLAGYLTSGTLPEGLKTALEQSTKAAKTTIISNFASRGLPTDPSKNSVLAQELAAVDAQAVISTAQMGQQLMQTGIQQTGMASDLYKTLVNIDMSMQAQIQKSIANFAAALNKK